MKRKFSFAAMIGAALAGVALAGPRVPPSIEQAFDVSFTKHRVCQRHFAKPSRVYKEKRVENYPGWMLRNIRAAQGGVVNTKVLKRKAA